MSHKKSRSTTCCVSRIYRQHRTPKSHRLGSHERDALGPLSFKARSYHPPRQHSPTCHPPPHCPLAPTQRSGLYLLWPLLVYKYWLVAMSVKTTSNLIPHSRFLFSKKACQKISLPQQLASLQKRFYRLKGHFNLGKHTFFA